MFSFKQLTNLTQFYNVNPAINAFARPSNVTKFCIIARLYAKETIKATYRIYKNLINNAFEESSLSYSLSTGVLTPMQKLRPHKLSFKCRNINVLTL